MEGSEIYKFYCAYYTWRITNINVVKPIYVLQFKSEFHLKTFNEIFLRCQSLL